MRIMFRRSGGFAGAILEATIDTDTLPGGEGMELEELVRHADLAHLRAASGPNGADRFQFEIKIITGGGREQFSFGEGQLTDPARRLVDRMLNLAVKRE